MTTLMANLSSSKWINDIHVFIPTLMLQATILACIASHVSNNPPRHLIYSGQKRLQYHACDNSLNKNNASQVLHMSAIEGEINIPWYIIRGNILYLSVSYRYQFVSCAYAEQQPVDQDGIKIVAWGCYHALSNFIHLLDFFHALC